MQTEGNSLRIAILDLYAGVPNQGMRCLRNLVQAFRDHWEADVACEEFEVRQTQSVPDSSFDIYLSSGGPGSPLESKGSDWEHRYFHWLHCLERWNADPANPRKKKVFFICHSFQLACRYYGIGEVSKRKSTSFGVFPMHLIQDGRAEPVFGELSDPFYAVDSRDYQVIQPHHNRLRDMGGSILCIEKERPHIPLERAIMAMRFSAHMIGTQFHPEADAEGMSMYLRTDEKKKTVIENHGYEKWRSMVEQLDDPDKIRWTYAHVLPNFLRQSAEEITGTKRN
ncbi:MAG: GMP synthase [Bacteroidetes bacterium]|nr:GMP synthase [Bacteroidota bacterium]